MDPFFIGMGFFPFIFFIIGIFLAILWTLLPFAVFGIKNRLDKLISELEKLNSKIDKIEKSLQQKSKEANKNSAKSQVDDFKKYMPKKTTEE